MYAPREHIPNESMLAWTSTGANFDELVHSGAFDEAESYVPAPYEAIQGTEHFIAAEYRKHIKHIALPMYRRLQAETCQEYLTPAQRQKQEMDISSMYGEYTELLEAILSRSSAPSHDTTRGILTEATFATLFSRRMMGTDEDRYIILPSSSEKDIADIQTDGTRTGVDLTIVDRATLRRIDTQIKTSVIGVQNHRYQQGIMMLNLEHIAGGIDRIPLLRQALINEVNGHTNDDEQAHIRAAEHRLYAKTEKRFMKQQRRTRLLGQAAQPVKQVPSCYDASSPHAV